MRRRAIYEYKYIKRIEFHEADPAGILHFSNYFRYMELAEHAFYHELGFSGFRLKKKNSHGWPRVKAQMDYLAPLAYDEEVEVHLVVEEKLRKVLNYVFLFRRVFDGRLVAKGRLTVVFVSVDNDTRKLKAAKIPDKLYDQISEAPKKLLEAVE
ncbi:thioesterase family protein [Acanthopleuribacter pedis]|uniref:Acyl-CoA thioesterase n=1 Tax=Acanthopleuribacter pedis TaxID=442870 RepID=A0A8J7QCM0_9BACT|nr:acyl-CoA thioesterase [Acanthopleuribacter pedis]MBO1318536.1 acyl-CoA thioesterase [Acanthopleuribacter pedis]